MRCPVCETEGCQPFQTVGQRAYWRCPVCVCTFLQPDQRPGYEAEQAEYRLHQNAPDQPGYRRFLQQLVNPLLLRLNGPSEGLDFGCGPGPVLAELLREAGHSVALYDPIFQPDAAVLRRTYRFITCSEVVEHFHQPAAEFRRLNALLAPGGWLALMTGFQNDDALFANWHYRRDPTHVVFFREETLQWLAWHHGWQCEIPCHNVALMRKPA